MKRPPTLAVLHLADLFRNPKMQIPAVRDWKKVRQFLDGTWPSPNPQYRTETSAHHCVDWMGRARHAPYVVIDTEFNAESGYLLLVGLGYPGVDQILQFDQRSAPYIERSKFGELLKALVQTTPVVFQNIMADVPILEQAYGITYQDYKQLDDTMLAHAVLWSDWPHTLEFLASIYGRLNKFKHLSGRDAYLYNVGDVVDTIDAWEGLKDEFQTDQQSESIYHSQSLPVVPTILRGQKVGLRVNRERVVSAMSELSITKEWSSRIAQAYCGWPINIGSDDQLKFELYDRQKLPVQVVPRTTKRTVDGDAIAALRSYVGPGFDAEEEAKNGLSIDRALQYIDEEANPVLEARVVYASAQQQLSHYIEPLIDRPKDGGPVRIHARVHPRFLIHAQASGRWSTVDPPMAQVPKHLQDIVIPDEGEKWIEWDWDQIELRILAALSDDLLYQQGFDQGWDIHTLNTCDVFGWEHPSDKRNPHSSNEDAEWRSRYHWGGKDDPRRRFAKVFIFRLNYGGEAKTATDIPGVKQLGLKASDLVDGSKLYLSKHPRIRQYWEAITREGIHKREVRTFMGRRRRLLVDSKSAMKRLIYNHPMQGGVSDIFNITFIKVAKNCPDLTFKYGVHDAQKWGVPEEKYDVNYERVYDIVHEPWKVNGKDIIFPATFKKEK